MITSPTGRPAYGVFIAVQGWLLGPARPATRQPTRERDSADEIRFAAYNITGERAWNGFLQCAGRCLASHRNAQGSSTCRTGPVIMNRPYMPHLLDPIGLLLLILTFVLSGVALARRRKRQGARYRALAQDRLAEVKRLLDKSADPGRSLKGSGPCILPYRLGLRPPYRPLRSSRYTTTRFSQRGQSRNRGGVRKRKGASDYGYCPENIYVTHLLSHTSQSTAR